MKRPAFQFYPADWRKDVELQSCSMAAQGLWINAMCVAHECEPYGHLTVNGKGMNAAQLGRQVGLSAKEAEALIEELLDAGVARRTAEGVIYSKRMVDDELQREARAEVGRQNGMKGKEFGALGAGHGAKGGRPRKAETPAETPPSDWGNEGGQKPPQNPHSSSSSSSSTTGIQASIEALSPPAEPTPPCPAQRLLDVFAEKLPQLPQPRRELWDGSVGADAMRQRWKWLLAATRRDGSRYASTTAEGVDWFGRFFATVSESDFLMGRAGKWHADLSWLMKKENFAKVVQGNYVNKEIA